MEKIQVEICLGTTCFVMGSSHLQELIEIIPKRYSDTVEVSGKPCLGLWSQDCEYSQAPYVKVDEEVVSQATVEKVLKVIEGKIRNNEK